MLKTENEAQRVNRLKIMFSSFDVPFSCIVEKRSSTIIVVLQCPSRGDRYSSKNKVIS